MTNPRTARPITRLLAASGHRRIDLAARAATSLDVLARIDRGDVKGMKLDTLLRVAAGLGVAVAELVPVLAVRPRGGLLQDRK